MNFARTFVQVIKNSKNIKSLFHIGLASTDERYLQYDIYDNCNVKRSHEVRKETLKKETKIFNRPP